MPGPYNIDNEINAGDTGQLAGTERLMNEEYETVGGRTVLRRQWDATARVVRTYDDNGNEIADQRRPFNDIENRIADRDALEQEQAAIEQQRKINADALIAAQLQLSMNAHEDGGEWTQPTGAANSYPVGAEVTHAGKTWESLTPFNVWEPGVSGWREKVAEGGGYPAWLQPTGGHDAYGLGARVVHNGQNWESTVAANVWEPGVYGWVVV